MRRNKTPPITHYAIRQKVQELIKEAGLHLSAQIDEDDVHKVADEAAKWADKMIAPKNPFLEVLSDIAIEVFHEALVALVWAELNALQQDGGAV